MINELLQHEIVVESLGGETQAIEVSADPVIGLDNLIEGSILLQAELADGPEGQPRPLGGKAWSSRAKLDRGRGMRLRPCWSSAAR